MPSSPQPMFIATQFSSYPGAVWKSRLAISLPYETRSVPPRLGACASAIRAEATMPQASARSPTTRRRRWRRSIASSLPVRTNAPTGVAEKVARTLPETPLVNNRLRGLAGHEAVGDETVDDPLGEDARAAGGVVNVVVPGERTVGGAPDAEV